MRDRRPTRLFILCVHPPLQALQASPTRRLVLLRFRSQRYGPEFRQKCTFERQAKRGTKDTPPRARKEDRHGQELEANVLGLSRSAPVIDFHEHCTGWCGTRNVPQIFIYQYTRTAGIGVRAINACSTQSVKRPVIRFEHLNVRYGYARRRYIARHALARMSKAAQVQEGSGEGPRRGDETKLISTKVYT